MDYEPWDDVWDFADLDGPRVRRPFPWGEVALSSAVLIVFFAGLWLGSVAFG